LYGDVGVFYTGRDWASQGNVVRWNYIHDVAENHGFGSQAFYLDDCDCGDVVMGNIVFGGAGKVGPASKIMYELFARRGLTRIFGKYDVDRLIQEPTGWMAVSDKLLLI
jgi:hypothetical protein